MNVENVSLCHRLLVAIDFLSSRERVSDSTRRTLHTVVQYGDVRRTTYGHTASFQY